MSTKNTVHCLAAMHTFPIHTDYTTSIHVHSTINMNCTQSDK